MRRISGVEAVGLQRHAVVPFSAELRLRQLHSPFSRFSHVLNAKRPGDYCHVCGACFTFLFQPAEAVQIYIYECVCARIYIYTRV